MEAIQLCLLLYIQMNSLWVTSDYKPFATAEWNSGLSMYASFLMAGRGTPFIIDSPLQPGMDGNCAVILYIRGYKPSWMMLPCGKMKSRYWICKKQPRVHNVNQNLDYPSLWCRGQCLLVGDDCYQHTLLHRYYNSSIGCSVDDPYLSHLNNYFANHGIDGLFFVDCTNEELCQKSERCKLPSQADKFDNQLASVKQIKLQKTDTNFSICGPAMQQCDDGSCRAQSIICIWDFQCSWNLCACTTGSNISNSMDYCRYQCLPGICTCSPLMFQCSTGGCIPYSRVCDNVYNCADSSDELCIGRKAVEYRLKNTPINLRFLITKSSIWCFGFICSSGLCIDVNFVNDLIPDCSDAEDESHSLAMKYQGSHFYCDDMQEIPCVPEHSKCFGIMYLCVYDHDIFGHISHCRSGAHLLNCRYMNCTNMFKCPRSYCIPLRYVCDGKHDCYDGEDENNCHNNICPGYLKCREVEYCIHPTEVCDGHPHCPHEDDEEFCDFLGCPTGCKCLGRGIVCRGEQFTYIPGVPFHDVIYISVVSGYIYSPTYSNFSSLLRLVILDLSGSIIINICDGFQKDYTFHGSLHALYLKRNYINYLSPFCFTKLRSLLVIDLQENPLVDIADDAFDDISLSVLVIRDTLVSSMTGQWIDGFYRLKTLDTRGVKLNQFSDAAVKSLNELETVYTDDPKLCCILRNVGICQDHMSIHLRCSLLLSRTTLSHILAFTSATSLFFMALSIWFVRKPFVMTRTVQFLLHNSILINRALCVFNILATVAVDIFLAKRYIFWYRSISSKLLCQGLYVINSSGMVMANISTSLLDHIAYLAVSRMLFNENDIHGMIKKLLYLMHFLTITIFSLITFVLDKELDHRFSGHHLCGSALGLSFNDHELSVTGAAFLSIVIFSTLTHSICMYGAILKNAYSSGKCVQTISSTKINIHRTRLFKLLKTLSHSAICRSLECLPIIFIIFLKLCGTDFSEEIQLISILTSIVWSCFGNTIPSVWYPTFRQIVNVVSTPGQWNERCTNRHNNGFLLIYCRIVMHI